MLDDEDEVKLVSNNHNLINKENISLSDCK
jgi:hypothetical protein